MGKEHKVFGFGYIKTGTTTLATCLEQLGYDHVSSRRDILIQVSQGDFSGLFETCDAHESFEDWPYPLAYKELFHRYGDGARYVLTVRRSPDIWLESLKAYTLRTSPTRHNRLMALGYSYPHGFEEEHLRLYQRHNAGVQDFFAAQGASHLLKVLCWESGDGWDELCSHIGEPVPETPFPHANQGTKSDALDHRTRENQRRILEQLSLLGKGDVAEPNAGLVFRVHRRLRRAWLALGWPPAN